ncbi:hypothetical protein FRB94_006080 [Tulasnella sp. JGI-2019a]|nr:hypothetical protein FRB94_006080 [Tulasnella sp. JGI-2019a]
MRCSLYTSASLVLSIFSSLASGLHLPARGRAAAISDLRRRDAGNAVVPLTNVQNSNYNVNITLGGVTFTVVIDTGSADLWVVGDVPNARDTGKMTSVAYAVGQVSGSILEAPLSFAGYNIPDQSFISVADASSFGSSLQTGGFNGLVGLAPTITSSIYTIFQSIDAVPMMNGIFEQNMTSQNYITLLLSRDYDPDSTAGSHMTVSEPLPGYESILQQSKLPVAIEDVSGGEIQFWMTYTDADGVLGSDGQPIPLKSKVASAWEGTLVAVFDSGYTSPQVPVELANTIYSTVPGAIWNATLAGGLWTVPCTEELSITFVFGGQKFFVHPLDLVMTAAESGNPELEQVNGVEMCYGMFQPMVAGANSSDYDMVLGMGFLRNTYILLDYGNFIFDSSTDRTAPYIQMLSTTDPVQAHADFVKVRLGGAGASDAMADIAGATTATKNNNTWIYVIAGLLCGVILLVVGAVLFRFYRKQNASRMQRQKRDSRGFFMIGQEGERKYRSMGAPVPAGMDDETSHSLATEEKAAEAEDESTPLTQQRPYRDPFQSYAD